MKNYLAIATIGLLGLAPCQSTPSRSENVYNKPVTTIIIKKEDLPDQAAIFAVNKNYAPQKDELVKKTKKAIHHSSAINKKEDLAFISIMRTSPEDCKKLLNRYLSAKKVPTNYWEIAADSINAAKKVKL